MKKLKVAVVGLGKMGLSHFSMVNAHPDVESVACDGAGFMVDVLGKNIQTPIYKDFDAMLAQEPLDAVVIATPSRLHAPMAKAALDTGLHVFCEKPFCLNWADSQRLTDLARDKGRVAQVGYHYRYVGAFGEMKRLIEAGAIGRITHVLAEAYGPVVLRSKKATWRTEKAEGGGCLYDYAAHPLNLLNWFFGTPDQVIGSHLGQVFSEGTDDEVFSTLRWNDGPTAQLSVNWSDESHRKMSTKISLIGTNGRLYADRQECQTYLRKPVDGLEGYGAGWTVKYTTELTEDRWFYLRGEEYSAQIDEFVGAIQAGETVARENDFASATQTDKTMAMIIENSETGMPVGEARAAAPQAVKKRSWFGR
ncbi:Gfo/Idh/MocA family oxidoreductase [uncultured Tateyamaria sp.]|uniref:Gfo/Idh/MocA family protein n=1 Tax=uncultured Tateyamaria sp. TaxID=455651 RepID=UPI00263501BC|nr:Gfo/Idh/MocA family oxidoreductase [uncultured Tateyamaria sp.]